MFFRVQFFFCENDPGGHCVKGCVRRALRTPLRTTLARMKPLRTPLRTFPCAQGTLTHPLTQTLTHHIYTRYMTEYALIPSSHPTDNCDAGNYFN